MSLTEETYLILEIVNTVFQKKGCYFLSVSSLQSPHKNILSPVRTEVSDYTNRPKFQNAVLNFPLRRSLSHATLNITAFYIEGKTTNANSDELLGMNLAKNVGSAVLNLTPHAPYLLAKKKVTITEKFVKKKKVKFEELSSSLEQMLLNQSCNAAFEDFLLTVNSSRYLHFFQDAKQIIQTKGGYSSLKNMQLSFSELKKLYDTYISVTASQHLLTDAWLKKTVFEEFYQELEQLKIERFDSSINGERMKAVMEECWQILVENLHPAFVSTSKEYQELKENLDGPISGLYTVTEESGILSFSAKVKSLDPVGQIDSTEMEDLESGGIDNKNRRSKFRIAIRSATNIFKFGLPEESKRPSVVPVKVEVRFIDEAMANTLRVYREAIQTRDILSRKISKLQSMRRELDMSLSEASAVTSTSIANENPVWNEILICEVDDVLLHGAYEYIRFDLVEDCDERWSSLGGFDIPLRYFHIGLQYDLRVTYDMTRRDYGHEMEPMMLSLSLESRNSTAGEIAELVDNPHYAIRAQIRISEFDMPLPMDCSHVAFVVVALNREDYYEYRSNMEAAVTSTLARQPILPLVNLPIKSRISLWDGPDTSILQRDEEKYGRSKGWQKTSILKTVPSMNSVIKFDECVHFDCKDLPVAFGVSYFGRRRGQKQTKFIGYSVLRIPSENNLDGSIVRFQNLASKIKLLAGNTDGPTLSGAYRIWNAPSFLDDINLHGIDPINELQAAPQRVLSDIEAVDWSQMTFGKILTNKEISQNFEKRNKKNNDAIRPSKPFGIRSEKVRESPRVAKTVKWFATEEQNISSNFKEDVRWIDKIRDPMWKSKVQAIHGSMKSDVDSMESILEAAMSRKDKSALKNMNSDAAMSLWKHAIMYPDLNKLPTTKQELYRQLVKTRADLKKAKEDNRTISSVMNGLQHENDILRQDKNDLSTQLSMVTARRDAVIVELKLARKRLEQHKATVHSAAVDAVSLRVKIKEAHRHKSSALRAMEHEKHKRERVEQHARELQAAQEAMEQASARQVAAASSVLATTSRNIKKTKLIEKERIDLAVKAAVEAAVAKVKHDFVVKEHKEHIRHDAIVHDLHHKLDDKINDLLEANKHIKRLENELHELRMKNVTAELAMMEVQLGMENTVSQKDQDVAFSVAGY